VSVKGERRTAAVCDHSVSGCANDCMGWQWTDGAGIMQMAVGSDSEAGPGQPIVTVVLA
jgi:dissimilatory sulfite reductase (desulfoviridin) alpha/beta subunit